MLLTALQIGFGPILHAESFIMTEHRHQLVGLLGLLGWNHLLQHNSRYSPPQSPH